MHTVLISSSDSSIMAPNRQVTWFWMQEQYARRKLFCHDHVLQWLYLCLGFLRLCKSFARLTKSHTEFWCEFRTSLEFRYLKVLRERKDGEATTRMLLALVSSSAAALGVFHDDVLVLHKVWLLLLLFWLLVLGVSTPKCHGCQIVKPISLFNKRVKIQTRTDLGPYLRESQWM